MPSVLSSDYIPSRLKFEAVFVDIYVEGLDIMPLPIERPRALHSLTRTAAAGRHVSARPLSATSRPPLPVMPEALRQRILEKAKQAQQSHPLPISPLEELSPIHVSILTIFGRLAYPDSTLDYLQSRMIKSPPPGADAQVLRENEMIALDILGSIGYLKGLEIIKDFFVGGTTEYHAAKAALKLGDLDRAFGSLGNPAVRKSSVYCHDIDLIEALAQTKDNRAANLLDFMARATTNKFFIRKIAAALEQLGDKRGDELFHRVGHGTMMIHDSFVAAQGDIPAVERILAKTSSPNDAIIHLQVLAEFAKHFRPIAEPPPSHNHIAKQAARIRAIVREKYHPEKSMPAGYGYENRGLRPGRRTTPSGADFEEVVLAPTHTADLKAINHKATARLGQPGISACNRYRTEESSKVMIVIDPKTLQDASHKEKIAVLAGTIAQMAIQKRDMVGLVVGRRKVYIKPSQDPAQVERVLTSVMSCMDAGEDKIVDVLDQDALRKNLPRGAEVYLVTDFCGEDISGLERMHLRYERLGVRLIPVSTETTVVVPRPVIKIGRFTFRYTDEDVRKIAGYVANDCSHQINGLLQASKGAVIDLEQSDNDKVVEQTVIGLGGRLTSRLKVASKATIKGEEVIDITSNPENPEGLIEAWERNMQELRSFGHSGTWKLSTVNKRAPSREFCDLALRAAFLNGWSIIIEYVYERIRGELAKSIGKRLRSLQDFFDNFHVLPNIEGRLEMQMRSNPLESLRLNLNPYAPISRPLTPSEEANLGSLVKFYYQGLISARAASPLKRYALLPIEQIATDIIHAITSGGLQKTQQPNESLGQINDVSVSLKSSIADLSPAISAVDRNKSAADENVWLRLSPVPDGNHRFLRSAIGAAWRGNGFEAIPEICNKTLAEAGAVKVEGKLEFKAENDMRIPQPARGRVISAKKKVVVFELNPAEPAHVRSVLAMPTSELQRKGPEIYGEDLYRTLTDCATLEEVERIDPTLAQEWRMLLERTAPLPVETAIAEIQSYIINHPRLKYHKYTKDWERTLFRALKRRIDDGTAELNEYLELIIRLGGGTCMEMATLGLTLLRLAGIPAGLSLGWVIENDGSVVQESHATPEVLIPRGNGKWHGQPVEFSLIRSGARLRPACRPAGNPGLRVSEIDAYWKQATLIQKNRIERGLDLLESALELRDPSQYGATAESVLGSTQSFLNEPVAPHILDLTSKAEAITPVIERILRRNPPKNAEDAQRIRQLIFRWQHELHLTAPTIPNLI